MRPRGRRRRHRRTGVARELRRATRALRCACSSGSALGPHQTGHNSGVIHAGIHYKPGSLKARLCVEGARELYEYCEQRGIAHERCGKLIVATDASQLARLEELERRARANGVAGLARLDAASIAELEPHARGVAALHSPARASSTSPRSRFLRADSRRRRRHRDSARSQGVGRRRAAHHLTHARGVDRARTRLLRRPVVRPARRRRRRRPDPRIVPFRGAYLRLRPRAASSCAR